MNIFVEIDLMLMHQDFIVINWALEGNGLMQRGNKS